MNCAQLWHICAGGRKTGYAPAGFTAKTAGVTYPYGR